MTLHSLTSGGRRCAALAAVTVWMLGAACGASSSSSSSNESPTASPTTATHIASVDARSLVTAAEASTAGGTTVTDPTAGAGPQTPGICMHGSSHGHASSFGHPPVYPAA